MGQSDDGADKRASRQRALAVAQPGCIATPDLATWLLMRGVKRVAGYLPLKSEVDVRPTLTTLAQADLHIALPRLCGNSLEFIIADTSAINDVANSRDFTTSALGTLEPRTGVTVSSADCDAILLPALACDRSGARLGRGGGYYDRALAGLPDDMLLIALVHDAQLWSAGEVPTGTHDVRVHAVATPTQLVITHHGERVISSA